MATRADGRAPDDLRPIRFERGFVALVEALRKVEGQRALRDHVAAVSVGMLGLDAPRGAPSDPVVCLDLDYSEDVRADVDMNVVMTGDAALVEVQATAERTPFSRTRLDELLELAALGIEEISAAQRDAVETVRAV